MLGNQNISRILFLFLLTAHGDRPVPASFFTLHVHGHTAPQLNSKWVEFFFPAGGGPRASAPRGKGPNGQLARRNRPSRRHGGEPGPHGSALRSGASQGLPSSPQFWGPRIGQPEPLAPAFLHFSLPGCVLHEVIGFCVTRCHRCGGARSLSILSASSAIFMPGGASTLQGRLESLND